MISSKLPIVLPLLVLLVFVAGCTEQPAFVPKKNPDVACRNGNAGLCYRLSMGKIAAAPVAALEYTERACNQGLTLACYNLGVLQEFGIGTPVSSEQAFKRYLQACEQGHQLACFHEANGYMFGVGTIKDVTAANQLFARSCTQKVFAECLDKAHQQAQQFGLEDDHVSASQCRKGWSQSCFHLGIAYQQAIGVKKDPVLAKKYYAMACSNGHQQACLLTAP